MSTDAEFMDYMEQCCQEGGVYGGVFLHVSTDDSIRLNALCNIPWKKDPPTRTRILSTVEILRRITKWCTETRKRVAKKLTS